jgi:diguanylate cyclase (GGDEF)-like protein
MYCGLGRWNLMPKSDLKAFSQSELTLGESSPLLPSTNNPVEREIERMGRGTFCWLRHPSPIEEHFEASSSAVRSRRMWIEGIFCVVLFNCFLITDYLLSPQNFGHFAIVRLGFGTPPAIVALILLRRGVSKAVREGMVVFICAIFAFSILYLYFDMSAVVSSYAVTDLAILLLYTNIGLRIRFPYAIFASGMCFTFGVIYVWIDSMLKVAEKVESLAILLSAILLSLIGNYSIERGERLSYLLRLQSDMESGVLTDANLALLRISNEDRLTGLANRRHFDEVYKRIWEASVTRGLPLSVIMIDIDNFKALNDRYGHQYGDAVLRRVAILLKQCLRVEGDFVARYGGEEFIVVLPDSSGEVAFRVAKRIRLLIEVAGSPAVNQRVTEGHGWSTVSCGVTTALAREDMDLSALIAQADKALYQAKKEGRNRVCVADEKHADSVL